MLDKNLVLLHPACQTRRDIIFALGARLHEKGYTGAGYAAAAARREEEYPTGLPTAPFGVAIPHAQGAHIKKSGYAVGVLQNDIPFQTMGDPARTQPVRVVIMLAVDGPQKQLDALQSAMGILSQPRLVRQLADAQNADEVALALAGLSV